MAKNKSHKTQAIAKQNMQISELLMALAEKRTGGAINFRGIGFQILVSTYLILKFLKKDSSAKIRLEGIEDIDVFLEDNQYIQSKSSQNRFDASSFSDLKVLQNFWKVYELDQDAKFKLIHNSSFAKGMGMELAAGNLSENVLIFWAEKLVRGRGEVIKFLKQISFEKIDEKTLHSEITKYLVQDYSINVDVEIPFIRALFYNVFEWSRNRVTVSYTDIAQLVQSVKDSFSKFPDNPAIQNRWITKVSYEVDDSNQGDFYEGKSAKPSDIIQGLPVKRKTWEDVIKQSIDKFDNTVVKSSSGQGKSTLAWMIGLTLKNENHSIYQLLQCSSHNEANAVFDFIQARLLVGELPVIIVDGLSQSTSGWSLLAQMLRTKTVKVIITSREEDWIRFGNDISTIRLGIINIRLSISEAKEIFAGLKKNQKLHSSIATWEPVWEKVKEKGLLIEYVFLLTNGEMIQDRLQNQIKTINSEDDSGAKLEILRLISLADVLNIKIRTQKLTDFILTRYQINSDRNELYKQLEKEYYLKFGEHFVEGLHPVRSMHLVNILNSHIPIETSLIELLELVDRDYLYEYFISVPLQFQLTDEFYRNAARILSLRTFPEMVYAIDGLMHNEPYVFWRENESIFNEIFKRGGLDISVHDTVPINKSNALEKLADAVSSSDAFRQLADLIKSMSPYDINKSNVYKFSKFLREELQKRSKSESIEGISFLYRWFQSMNLLFPDIISVNEADLVDSLKNKNINDVSELFKFYHIQNPSAYELFVEKYKAEIIGAIKKNTNTLTIEEHEGEIVINYLLDNNLDRINENSVYRINIVRSFFPGRKAYNTKAILLPFPNEYITKAALDQSVKRISPENLVDEFNIHINQIWSKVILDQYSASSVFEWQKEHVKLREKRTDLAKKLARLLESILEKNESKKNSLLKELSVLAPGYLDDVRSLKKYPSHSPKYFEKSFFDSEQNKIATFTHSFGNFVNQLVDFLNPRNNQDLNLPVINIKDSVRKLDAMQAAYEKMMNETFRYFPTQDIIRNETVSIGKLSGISQFFAHVSRGGYSERIVLAEKSAQNFLHQEELRLLGQLKGIILLVEENVKWIFTLPTKVIDEDNVRYAIIGVQGFDNSDLAELWEFSIGFQELANTEIDFFTFVFANDKKEVTHALRFSRDYFVKFKQAQEGVVTDEENFNPPLPIMPENSALQLLNGFVLRGVASGNEYFYKMMFDVWKLSESRRRLDKKSKIELDWLEQLEAEYKEMIKPELNKISKSPDYADVHLRITSFLNERVAISNEEIIQIMMSKALSTQLH